MSGLTSAVVARVVSGNSRRMADRATDAGALNPRPLQGVRWAQDLAGRQPRIRAEWERFEAAGGGLPSISQLIDEDQGEDGVWRAGLLVSRGRPAGPLPGRFPDTMAALALVPGLWSALFSVLEPRTEIPEHCGFNAGVLRYHLGVRCDGDTALRVADRVTPYVDGVGVLFDDTEVHAAWNRSGTTRVTLFCELLRPAGPVVGGLNRAVQQLIALDPRYRRAPERAAEWDAALAA